jgi:hypothetical protein
MISNYSHFADIIRYNRILAYKQIRLINGHNARQSYKRLKQVRKIRSASIGVSRAFNKYYEIEYNPIFFSEYDELNKVEVIGLKCLGNKVKLYPSGSLRYTLSIIELNNLTQYNAVLNSFSWKFKSRISYMNSFESNQEAYFGISWNFINRGLFYGLVGLNCTNFNDISNKELGGVKLLPAIQVGLTSNLVKDFRFLFSYENKFEKDYLIAGIIYKKDDLLNKLLLIGNRDNKELELSVEYLY